MTHATCRLTARNRDQLWNPTLCNRVWATFFTTVCVCVSVCEQFCADSCEAQAWSAACVLEVLYDLEQMTAK